MTTPLDPIAAAEKWAFARRRTDVLSIEFVVDLHGRMFGDMATWAGVIRSTEDDRGVPVAQIRTELQSALTDVKRWTEAHTYKPDERAERFHRRLTQIRAFQHGNGRHARLMTDVLLFNLGRPRFSWGASGERT